MSFSLVKSATTRLLTNCRQIGGAVARKHVKSSRCQTQRAFTRSLWYMSGNHTTTVPVGAGATVVKLNKTCTCCLHTEGDKDLIEFLSEEITAEKKTNRDGKLPKVRGFDASYDGANVVLTKEADGEKITVRFNVNNSVGADDNVDIEDPNVAEEEGVEMLSQPAFTVEINKGGDQSLSINCNFTMQHEEIHDAQEQFSDAFEIEEVAMTKGEWEDETYCVSSQVMDGRLYDLLMNMLEERGVDATFTEALVKHSTAYEHSKYITFLQDLQKFAGGK